MGLVKFFLVINIIKNIRLRILLFIINIKNNSPKIEQVRPQTHANGLVLIMIIQLC